MKVKKRGFAVLIIFMMMISILVIRLVDIQLLHPESFTSNNINLIKSSVSQRTQEIVIDQGRGRFIDRNANALTHEYYPSLVLFPFLKNTEWPVEQVSDILEVPSSELTASIEEAKEPVVFGKEKPLELTETQMNRINELEIPGVFAVYRQYAIDSDIAEHLLGIIRENHELLSKRYPEKTYLSPKTKVGITGLQAAFDEFLLPEGEAKLLYHVAGDGNPLFGIDVKYTAPANPYYPVSIKTTIDREMQQLAEKLVEEHGIKKGGVVLLDVKTSDILAMVSAPSINHSNPFGDGSADNQMLLPHFPGSVFKIVTTAAVIEKNVDVSKRTFNCDLDLYGQSNPVYELGELDFRESFAKSCNYTFTSLAQELIEKDSNIIEEYAAKLGLITPVGWHGDVFRLQDFKQLSGEYKGSIWGDEKDKSVPKAVAQISIGQKDVRVTPLAIANMMATIARGGEIKQVRAVSEVLYKNGTTLFSFPEQSFKQEENIAPYTAMKLQELMQEVVESGTGSKFQSLPYKVAGKSGTAEIGREVSEGSLVNKWFAGYFPAEEPRYALVVVDLEQIGSKSPTNDVYFDMVNGIYQINLSRNETIKES
ncbi:peptidoglycan D,D-transpeptidase FtsI family protein [Bacillus sp. PS06]|uniref:peptidoglycan D,D-transpeptidase FtsI family protein n=1 Tax=Bacillus sp. PS06 TaxID=2764176 RepID=UPI001786B7CB|nr:penicillin-binding transpeptidase domain-containing protein [Bacillus sp. PS06]MBD8069243.1 penicillin-binding protein 2 [Bacillus sp. PS06]